MDLATKLFNQKGLKLLAEEYSGVDTPMKCLAKCGHIKNLSLSNLRIDHGLYCRKCSYSVGSSKRKHSYNDVKAYFKRQGCTLKSKVYTNWRTKLEYTAQCGHPNQITFHKFRNESQGRVCRPCGRPRREQHYKYNPNLTDSKRLEGRDVYANIEWRKNVYKRDAYTCQSCKDDEGGNLIAHHLDSYGWAIDKRFDVDNGVTLCLKCHKDFHGAFGYGKNTRKQFNEWLNGNTEVKQGVKALAHRNA